MTNPWPYVRYNGTDVHWRWLDPAFRRGLAEAAEREDALRRKRQEERKRKQDRDLTKQRTIALMRATGVKSAALALRLAGL